TYIGGTNSESFDNFSLGGVDYRCEAEMQNDNLGNVYVYTASSSANFPTTPGVISNVKKGFSDAVFFKLNTNLSNLVWSTYLGGSSSESGKSIRFDGTGGFYLAGTTSSTDFPVTSGALQTTKAGLAVFSDFYITHINSTANSIIASTYLGVQGHDILAFMDLDMNNDVYICGHTGTSSQFIPTAGTYS
ncbi:MAG TPA: SBBP repeat-containing protein, partial [Bacteroidia bacterium]|nr:SBBP repeat-containing protein [Bacteroidia bacterium]